MLLLAKSSFDKSPAVAHSYPSPTPRAWGRGSTRDPLSVLGVREGLVGEGVRGVGDCR